MAIEWKKQREHRTAPSVDMERFIDGRFVDAVEMRDRVVIFQQTGLMLSVPYKRNHATF
jgi:hypothetical protein